MGLEVKMDEKQVEKVENKEPESEEDSVDLNRVFKQVERDLNSMFPDGEMRKFLRQIDKNRRSNERFLEGIDRARLWEDEE
jgi:hypothetical protein